MKPKVTMAEVEETMFGMATTGVCLECGMTQEGCEPDARFYPCESCGEDKVFGLQEAVLMNAVEVTE